jgi:hypothetical protein
MRILLKGRWYEFMRLNRSEEREEIFGIPSRSSCLRG